MTESVKLGTARSRIRIGEESNGFPGAWTPQTHCRENNPMHSREVIDIASFCTSPSGGGWAAQLYCVLATLGGWADVMKLVASSIEVPAASAPLARTGPECACRRSARRRS